MKILTEMPGAQDIHKYRQMAFCQTKVKFAEFQASSDGYCIDPSIAEALAQFQTAANRSDLRFLGLVNNYLPVQMLWHSSYSQCAPYWAQKITSCGHLSTTTHLPK